MPRGESQAPAAQRCAETAVRVTFTKPTASTTNCDRGRVKSASLPARGETEGRQEQPPISSASGRRSLSAARRICIEKEAAQRSQIYLQQLESWKELRVAAFQVLFVSLPSGARSTSSRSVSSGPRWGGGCHFNGSSGNDSLLQTASCLHAPLHGRCRSGASAPSTARSLTAEPASPQFPPEQCYEYETQWALRRSHCLQEQGNFRREEDHLNEIVALRDQLHKTQQQLQEACALQENAAEEGRIATERVEVLTKQVSALEDTLKSVTAASKESMDSLRIREQQMDALSSEVRRLKDENSALMEQKAVSEGAFKQQVQELEVALADVKERESVANGRLQSVRDELKDAQRVVEAQKSALRESSLKTNLMEQKLEEVNRQLTDVTRISNKERDLARQQAIMHVKELEESRAKLYELQQRYEEEIEELKGQVALSRDVAESTRVSGVDTTIQQENGVSSRYQCVGDARQLCIVEDVEISAESSVKEGKNAQLLSAVKKARQEMLSREEHYHKSANTACGLSRLNFANEDKEIELMLRDARREFKELCLSFSEVQKERDEECARRERAEAALCDLQEQVRRSLSLVADSSTTHDTVLNTNGIAGCSITRGREEVDAREILGGPFFPIRARCSPLTPKRSCGSSLFSGNEMDELVLSIRKTIEVRVQQMEVCLSDAVAALLCIRECVVHGQQGRSQQTGHPFQTLDDPLSGASKKSVVKLLEAVSAVSATRSLFEVFSQVSGLEVLSQLVDKRFVKVLCERRHSVRVLVQELTCKENRYGFDSVSDHLPDNSLLLSLSSMLDASVNSMISMGCARGSEDDPAQSPQYRPVLGAGSLVRVDKAESGLKSPLGQHLQPSDHRDVSRYSHTVGVAGGRIEVSQSGKLLRRLLLPSIVDIMSCSALGSVSHNGLLAVEEEGTFVSPNSVSCFSYSVRVGVHCSDVLIGFADSQLPLEVFAPVLNSVTYTGCYFLHLGRGTLYCPLYGLVDMPYPAFSSRGPVQTGEEIRCVLDTAMGTIHFWRGDVDCGLAFEHVSLRQPLFPAFELNSRGCEVELL
ncbi:hypothetical protein TRVL_05761 [Trypanosoma vivax]|nr:hypothetical protein TRVL_05761 [Trypanosoma vivax]